MWWKRKVRTVGRGSFITTLPKLWVEWNGFHDGDTLTLIDEGGVLVVLKEVSDKRIEELEAIIDRLRKPEKL